MNLQSSSFSDIISKNNDETITALLWVGILASAMLSCGTEDSKIETATTDMPTEDITTQEETGITLGIPKEDNGGKSFRMLIPSERAYEFPNDYIGDVVNDALYDRNMKTEEHFNIRFDYQYEAGNWDERSSYMILSPIPCLRKMSDMTL